MRYLPPIPDAWIAEASDGSVAEGEWWREFGSAELDALVRRAITNNYDLRAAAARVEAAVAQARIAGAALKPTVDAGFTASRRQQKFVGLPIPGAPPDTVLTSRSTAYGASLDLSWEVDLWGRLRAGARAALADVEGAEEDFRAARQSLAAQTAKAWLAVIESRRQLELARETLRAFEATARQVRERYRRGIRSPLDARLAAASAESAAALVAQREAQALNAARQLEILLGDYPRGGGEREVDLPALTNEIPAGVPSNVLARRPDLAAAERRLAAANARVTEAKAAMLPRIALTTSGGRTSAELSDLLSNNFNVWALGANLAQPILNGGRLRAGARLARARYDEAIARFGASALRAFSEVEAALADEEHLAERERRLAAAARESREAARLAEQRYRGGLEEFVTVLEAQRRSLEAESGYLAARRLRLDNRVDLHLALGGGFGAGESHLAGGRKQK